LQQTSAAGSPLAASSQVHWLARVLVFLVLAVDRQVSDRPAAPCFSSY
jgi:hypothetical protein